MERLTSRERVVAAIHHQEPDRVPFDCPMTYQAYSRVRDTLGFQESKQILPSGPDLSVRPSEEFLWELGVDLIYIGLNGGKDDPPFELGTETYTDEWGIQYQRMESNFGISYEISNHPLANAALTDLDHYAWPDPYDPLRVIGLKEKCEALYSNTEFAIVGKFSTSIFEQAFYLRGFEQFLMDIALNPDFACALLEKTTEIAIGMVDVGLKACGKYIQILRLAGDDMGHQSGTLLSPATFRKMIKPYFSRLYSFAKSWLLKYNPTGKIMAHTDGDVYRLIPDYIEMGLDILNPVQPGVTHMDHEILKKEFGDRLSFHAGIDIQHLLPHGSPNEIKEGARQVICTLGKGGGYILAPTHYLLPDVPPENMLALRDAVMEYGNYPLD